jgi:3-deoxy-D-manno-octulosonate 8-phosphate phosphatase (KDO 8-P phosphatase)
VRAVADCITTLPGGRGAVREVIEMVLKAKGRWDDLVRNYIH